MRWEYIDAWLEQATAAPSPADLERVLDAACCQLSESEYTALLGQLSSAAQAAEAELEQTITQVMRFPDGSRLTVKVETPPDEGLSQAHEAYYTHLFERLGRIEQQFKTSV